MNKMVLTGLKLDDGIVPGEIRSGVVTVSDYRSPESSYTEELVDRLIKWIASPEWTVADDMPHFVRAILQAIVTHLYIAWLHPFGGSRRAARLVGFEI